MIHIAEDHSNQPDVEQRLLFLTESGDRLETLMYAEFVDSGVVILSLSNGWFEDKFVRGDYPVADFKTSSVGKEIGEKDIATKCQQVLQRKSELEKNRAMTLSQEIAEKLIDEVYANVR